MSRVGLFEEAEIPQAPASKAAAMRERLESAYAKELLVEAPVSSLKAGVPEREETAKRLAAKDVARVLRSLSGAGLQLADTGRVADLKACVADWLRLSSDNEAMGEESVDYEELKAKTRRLIHG